MAELGNRILVVENSAVQARIISEHIEDVARFDTISASTMEQVQSIVAERRDELFLAVCNLGIKGAEDGQAVDLLLGEGVPVIVLTSTFDDALRNRYLEKRVLDYFVKGLPGEMDGLVDLVGRVWKNRETTVVVADDTLVMRRVMQDLLEKQHFNVITAEDGKAALDAVVAHPEVRMLVTDFEMPGMDGIELVRRVREHRTREELAVIGVSGHDSGALTARFLKNGANDFLKKPFEAEEFSWRVNKNVGELERVRQIRETVRRDPMTGCLRLRWFVAEAEPLCATNAHMLAGVALTGLAGLNVDKGFGAGDEAVEAAAGELRHRFPDAACVGRLGAVFFVALAADAADVKARLGQAVGALGGDSVAALTPCGAGVEARVQRLMEHLLAPGAVAGSVTAL